MPRRKFDYERFVQLWQSPMTVAEVTEAMGLRGSRATSVASKLRARGVQLVYKTDGGGPDIDRLKELAQEAL